MSSDFVSFDFVKKSVSIVQVLDHYGITGSLKRKGDSLAGPCPLDGGRNPTCFRVSVSKNCFNCFGKCKAGGNILDLVSKKEGVPIRDAALLISGWFDLKSPKAAKGKPAKKEAPPTDTNAEEESTAPNPPLPFALKNLDPAHPYLVEQGFSPETIAEFGAGFCAKGVLAGRIAVQIHNARAELVGYGGRWPGDPPKGEEAWKYPPTFRKSAEVFNLHRAMKEPAQAPLIIVKDIFVVMKLWQFGMGKAVAVMDSTLSTTQWKAIERAMNLDRKAMLLFAAELLPENLRGVLRA